VLKTVKHLLTVTKDGRTYTFNPGDVVEPDVYGIPDKYFDEGYPDKMVKSQAREPKDL